MKALLQTDRHSLTHPDYSSICQKKIVLFTLRLRLEFDNLFVFNSNELDFKNLAVFFVTGCTQRVKYGAADPIKGCGAVFSRRSEGVSN